MWKLFTLFADDITTDNTYVACDWDSRWKDECYDLSEAEVPYLAYTLL